MDTISFRKLSWQDIERDCIALAQTIPADSIDTIVAISRGGLVFARILSDLLKKPISHITITSYDDLQKTREPFIDETPSKMFRGESILIVDEICDTGKTFVRAKSYFENFPLRAIFTATPYLKPRATFIPNFWVKKIDGWIVFPYELRETAEAIQKMTGDREKTAERLKAIGLEEWEIREVIDA